MAVTNKNGGNGKNGKDNGYKEVWVNNVPAQSRNAGFYVKGGTTATPLYNKVENGKRVGLSNDPRDATWFYNSEWEGQTDGSVKRYTQDVSLAELDGEGNPIPKADKYAVQIAYPDVYKGRVTVYADRISVDSKSDSGKPTAYSIGVRPFFNPKVEGDERNGKIAIYRDYEPDKVPAGTDPKYIDKDKGYANGVPEYVTVEEFQANVEKGRAQALMRSQEKNMNDELAIMAAQRSDPSKKGPDGPNGPALVMPETPDIDDDPSFK